MKIKKKEFIKKLEEGNISYTQTDKGLIVHQIKSVKKETKEVEGKKIYTVIISKEIEDRDGEIVDIQNMNTEEFMENSVILLFHNQYDFPVAKGIRMYGNPAEDGFEMLMEMVFQDVTEIARNAEALWDQGFLNTVSIGFLFEEYKGVYLTGVKLLEVSIVPVPSNPKAQAVRTEEKRLTPEEIKKWEEHYKNEKPASDILIPTQIAEKLAEAISKSLSTRGAKQ